MLYLSFLGVIRFCLQLFEDSGCGDYLGPAPLLPAAEQDALIQARLAFASQPWL